MPYHSLVSFQEIGELKHMNPLNRAVVSTLRIFPRRFVKPFAMRYIAGESVDDAVRVTKELNARGIMTTIDVLGENVETMEEALTSVKMYEEVLKLIHEQKLDANVSIKLSDIGFNLGQDLCFDNAKRIVEIAKGYGNFVRIDMEDSTTTSATLKIYEKLRAAGFDNTGVVIQARLRRSEEDVKRLVEMRASVRLCKGIYIEPASIAFQNRDEIRRNYIKLLKMLLEGGCRTGIATHDELIIKAAYDLIGQLSKSEDGKSVGVETATHVADYEFQMLLGVRPDLRDKIVADGNRLRVYVPFGEQWYTYSMRRFKENPQVAGYVFKSVFWRNGK
jgi:proline dehydrogenase